MKLQLSEEDRSVLLQDVTILRNDRTFVTMAYDENLADRIRDILDRERVPYEEKRMMGGLCFLVRGKMCMGVEKKS